MLSEPKAGSAMDLRDNLRKLMDDRKFSASALTRAARLGGTAVWDILAGKSKNPRIDTLEAIAQALGVSIVDLIVGDVAQPQRVAIIGSVEEAEHWELGCTESQAVALRIDGGGEAIAIRVRGNAMAPAYRDGDTLIGQKVSGAHADNLVGQDVIVLAEDNRRYVKVLQRGSIRGRYTLRSLSPRFPDIENVRVKWVAPIQWVRRSPR